jgi:O-antigen/teichoic acid export membrane protein
MADQCFASASNFVVGVVVARIAGPAGLGAFAFAYGGWILLTNFHRALITDPMAILGDVRTEDARNHLRDGFAAEVALGAVATLLFIAVGLSLVLLGARDFGVAMLAVAPWITFLNLQDYWRWLGFMHGKPQKSLLNDAVFDVGEAAALTLVALSARHSVVAVISAWGVGAAVAAAYGLKQFGVRPQIRGGFRRLHSRWHMSKWLAATSATNWGSSQLNLIIPGMMLGPAALGGLKATWGLVTGPAAPILQAGSSFGLPEASKALDERGWHGMRQVSWFVTGIGVVTITVIGLAIFLDGRQLLTVLYGPRFAGYEGTARILTVAFLVTTLGTGAALSLKAAKHTRSLFGLQLFVSVISIPAVVAMGLAYGLNGAAAANIATAMAGLGVLLYLGGRARRSFEHPVPVFQVLLSDLRSTRQPTLLTVKGKNW